MEPIDVLKAVRASLRSPWPTAHERQTEAEIQAYFASLPDAESAAEMRAHFMRALDLSAQEAAALETVFHLIKRRHKIEARAQIKTVNRLHDERNAAIAWLTTHNCGILHHLSGSRLESIASRAEASLDMYLALDESQVSNQAQDVIVAIDPPNDIQLKDEWPPIIQKLQTFVGRPGYHCDLEHLTEYTRVVIAYAVLRDRAHAPSALKDVQRVTDGLALFFKRHIHPTINSRELLRETLQKGVPNPFATVEVPQMRQTQMVRTPTGPLTLIRPIAEKLLTEGVISGTLDGDLHAADAATVKAAIMASAVCDFCSSPGASHYFDVPDFSIGQLPGNYGAGRSTGGWMACDDCNTLIIADKRASLVDRAINTMAFPKFSRRAVEELIDKFWQGMADRQVASAISTALGNIVEDTLPETYKNVITARDQRVEAVARVSGLTRAEVEDAIAGRLSRDAVVKLVKWRKTFGHSVDTRAIAERIAGIGPKPPLPDLVPHWQRALDMRFKAMQSLSSLLHQAGARHEHFTEAVDLKDASAVKELVKASQSRQMMRDMGFDADVRFLKVAQAYSFNSETMAAIREATRSIPRESALSEIETPATGAGWFWFSEPMPVTASPIAADKVHALLWGWTNSETTYEITFDDELLSRLNETDRQKFQRFADEGLQKHLTESDKAKLFALVQRMGISRDVLDRKTTRIDGEPMIMFSAYVIDEHGQLVKPGVPSPSTRWHWPLSLSFEDMLAYNGAQWDKEYGPGGPFADDPHVMGKELTLKAVADLSLFFAMACVWFKQTVAVSGKARPSVLTQDPGHIERHARKRYAKEHKLDAPPTVQVVALRKSMRVDADQAPAERREGARNYGCRWIVQGHPRRQPCGPGRKDRKLIWIEAHIAGPDDKPLRTRDKVYAVVR